MNYSNQILHTIAQQLYIIDNFIPLPKHVKNFKIDPTRPIYHYHTPSTQELKGTSLGRDANHKIEELVEKLRTLSMRNSSREINTLSREEEFDNMVSKLGGRASKPKTQNHHPTPPFADVQFEEISNFVEKSYSGESIV